MQMEEEKEIHHLSYLAQSYYFKKKKIPYSLFRMFLKIEFYFTSGFCSEHETAIRKNVYVISRGIIEYV